MFKLDYGSEKRKLTLYQKLIESRKLSNDESNRSSPRRHHGMPIDLPDFSKQVDAAKGDSGFIEKE